MPTRIVDVQFPLAGLNRAQAFSKQSQAPYTTYDAENVRPLDRELDRLTGGSRPGLSMYSDTTALASGSPVQVLESVSVKKEGDFSIWEDTFNYTSMAHYSTIPNYANTTRPTIVDGMATCPASATVPASFMIPSPTGFNADLPFCVSAFLVTNPAITGSTGHVVNIYFGMSGSGDEGNCYYLECTRATATGGVTFFLYKNTAGVRGGVLASGSATEAVPVDGWIDVELSGSSFVAYYRGVQVASATLATPVSSSTPRVGIGLSTTSANANVPVQISRVSMQYYTTSPRDTARRRLITAIDGTMYREGFRGRLTASTSQMKIASSGVVEAAESGQKLYIADSPAIVASGTDGAFSSSGTVFDAASVSDWTTVITNARRGDYYLQVEPIPRGSTAIAGSYTFSGDDLQSTRITDGYFGKSPSVTIYVTNGTLTLSTVSGLAFTVGDGTADSAMAFTSNAATPALKWAALSAALTNAVYTSTATNNVYAELTLQITGATQGRTDTFKIKKQIDNSDVAEVQGLSEFVTNFDIDAVASGNLTITGGPNASTTGVTWRILRSPKVYDPLADEETVVASGTNGVITSSSIFDSATYVAWAATMAGKDLSKYSVQILTAGVVTSEYPIVGYDTSNIAGDVDHLLIGPATNATGLTFQIARKDKLVKWTARRGEVPVGCSMIERYQDRVVMAGNARSPQNWYMSRMGDAMDFQYSDVDVGAAVMGINSPAGVIGDAITALIPYNDDNFFFGCRSSLWLLRGNPAGGGRIDSVSYTIGVLSSTSWCHGPTGEVIWISRDGIYYTSPQCLSCEPIAISRDKLPREFIDINPDLYHLSMAYDVRARGVHIFVTPKVTGGSDYLPVYNRHWFIHWDSKSFWPVSFANKAHNPILVHQFTAPSPEDSGVLVAGFDGDIFRFSRTTSRDNLTAMASYVNFGPMPIVNSPYHRGIIRTIDVVMGETSEDTTWALYEGDTAEAVATASTAFQTGTFSEGAQTTIAPLMGGSNWRMKISSSGPWSFSSATAVISQLGKDRSYG